MGHTMTPLLLNAFEQKLGWRIDFGNNLLSGPVPSEFGELTDAKGLLFTDNLLTGTLPSQLGLLQKLSFLRCRRIHVKFGRMLIASSLW